MIYEIQMSKGPSIKIDEEDLAKIKTNIGESLIQVKQGIINPSFMISINPTDEKEFIVKTKIAIENGSAKVVSREEVRALDDKMNIKNLKQLK